MIEAIAAALRQSAEVHRRLSVGGQDAIARAAEAISKALEGGNKLLIFGNGGSAADAQHIASEFVGRFSRERGGLPALALTTDSSALTSIGNDLGFDAIFARQLEALGAPGDVALGISTSGKSANVLSAVQVARRMGLVSIGLTGGDGGELVPSADISIVAPTDVVPRIQECHITIGHVLCDVVEAALLHAPTERAARGPKLINLDELEALREQWRREGQTVVWTNGCFDILHAGHVRSLAAAKALGDVLIVGINDDRSVRELKGPGRPLVPVEDRAELLAALEPVDYVVVFDGPTPEPALERLRPDVHCKGGDYAPPNGRPVPEAKLVAAYGGRVEFLPFLPGHSTSVLIDRIRASREHGPSAPMASRSEEVVRAFAAGRVVVVGDVMIDEYLSGETDRVSPEAPVPVVNLRRRSYAVGGAANAAANVAALGGKVSLAGVVGEDQHAETLRGLLTERIVDHRLVGVGDRPTTTKTRVLANGQQVARVDTESASAIPAEAEQELIEWASEKLDSAGAVVLSDYEKGSLTDRVAQGVIAAAAQRATPVVADPKWHFSKFRGSTVLTPNVAETLAALGRRDGSAIDTTEMSSLFDTLAASSILVTRGSDGMSLFRAGGDVLHIRTAARHVYDVTGAGDTVAATLALGIATDLDLAEAARAANAAAGVVIGKVGTATVDPGEFVAALVGGAQQ